MASKGRMREREEGGEGEDGNVPGEIGARTHPRTMYKEVNLNELICHISLGRGRHSGRDFGPAFHTETEERNLHYHHNILSLIITSAPAAYR